jgi:hypothetical protein
MISMMISMISMISLISLIRTTQEDQPVAASDDNDAHGRTLGGRRRCLSLLRGSLKFKSESERRKKKIKEHSYVA